jgi:pSer/pThr/pTyr-binding forkhead associated (FHA) protein
MSTNITGVVSNGVVVPDSPLPEGSRVEIHLQSAVPEALPIVAVRVTPGELRKMPREQRQAILAAAAEMAVQDYKNDKELTGFDAFSEEELNDDESDSG